MNKFGKESILKRIAIKKSLKSRDQNIWWNILFVLWVCLDQTILLEIW